MINTCAVIVEAGIENRKHHIRGGLPMMHVIDEGIFRGFMIPTCHFTYERTGCISLWMHCGK